ncbi:MAG: lipocalin family protein [Pseudomonadota bacterium]
MRQIISSILIFALLSGCATQRAAQQAPIATVPNVDLERFAGRWYVIANIPTFIETKAWNATEDYTLRSDQKIDTTFSFNKGGFDGKRKIYTPVATVRPGTGNAVWGMQFIWPFKAEYRVIWLADDYSVTIIGRSKRDYVWVMAREPSIDQDLRRRLDAFLAEQGYDLSKLRDVPQQPLAAR